MSSSTFPPSLTVQNTQWKTKEEKDAEASDKSRKTIQKRIDSKEYLQNLAANQLLLRCENTQKASPELDKQAAEIEERIAQTKNDARTVGPISPSKAEEFLQKRSVINMLSVDYCKDARKLLENDELPPANTKTRKRQFSEIAELEDTVMKERAIILGNNAKLQLSMTYHANYVTLGEAYLYSIVENLPLLPAEAHPQYSSKQRFSPDQTHFKKNLESAYESLKGMKANTAWCPVAGEVSRREMKAAHIVPQSIGEFNAAYLFGANGLGEGHGKLWGLDNGMHVSESVEQAMDAAQIVFVPGSKKGELKTLLLDQDLANEEICFHGPTWADIDNKPLMFRTDVRPGLHAIYIHAFISVLRRKLYDCKNWQHDVPRIFSSRIWSDVEGQKLKRSTVLAIAAEIGDLDKDMVEQLDLERSGMVDAGGKPVEMLDRKVAAIIRGLWVSQDEFKPWYELNKEIKLEQEEATLEREFPGLLSK